MAVDKNYLKYVYIYQWYSINDLAIAYIVRF